MLVTRCPACLKAFKVVKDQLKLSQGWVRCGHCGEVFHAATHFVQRAPTQTPQVAAEVQRPAAVTAPPSAPAESIESVQSSKGHNTPASNIPSLDIDKPDNELHSLEYSRHSLPPPPAEQTTGPAEIPLSNFDDVDVSPQTLLPDDSVSESRIAQGEEWDSVWPLPAAASAAAPGDDASALAGPTTQEQFSEASRQTFTDSELRDASRIMTRSASDLQDDSDSPSAVDVARMSALIDTSDPAEDSRKRKRRKKARRPQAASSTSWAVQAAPGFVRAADRAARWRSTPVRAALLLVLVAAVVTALLQAAFYFRESLVLRWPESKQYLVMLCEHAGCQLEPVQRIEAVAIESSSLVKQSDDLYELNILLRNQLSLANRLPHIELTLQDLASMPVTRKVIEPTAYALAPRDLNVGIAARGEYRATLRISTQGAPVLGFKLDLFFPDQTASTSP
jgi:predicted Zn finger-like uncharacterized protein